MATKKTTEKLEAAADPVAGKSEKKAAGKAKQRNISPHAAMPDNVDMSLLPSRRPLTGPDIDRFRTRNGLSIAEASHALALTSPAAYGKACRLGVLPITREVLIRLYDMSPRPVPWVKVRPAKAFEMIYGEILSFWKGKPEYEAAKLDLYGRFTLLLGRESTDAYRWIGQGGAARNDVLRILAKLTDFEDQRIALEGAGKHVLRLRGIDLDQIYPLPTEDNPPRRRLRGRPKASASE
jgi:hypothetical protein